MNREYITDWRGIGQEIVELSKEKPPFLISKHLHHRRKERLVRCRDCKYWEPPRKTEHDAYPPTCIGLGGMWGQANNEDGNGYCAWGERRDGE